MKNYIAFICILAVCPAYADMYSELQKVYDNNPTIRAAMADVNVATADVNAARTGYQPYLGLAGNIGVANTNLHTDNQMLHQFIGGSEDYVPSEIGVQFQQNLFSGFSTVANIKSTKAARRASESALSATQSAVFYDAINAYINVLNTRELLKLAEGNEKVLTQYYDNFKSRQKVGQMTKTDVAQASARLEGSKYQTADARANYDNAIETFKRIYGTDSTEFTDIDISKMDKYFPESLESAEEYALNHNQSLAALDSKRDAVNETVVSARKSMLPSVDLRASYMQVNNMPYVDRIRDGRVGVYVSVPLYDKGGAFSQVDKVRATVAGIDEQRINAQNTIVENIRSAWNIYNAQETAITAGQAAVKAAEMALSGVKDEQRNGRRTVLDVLNAEQELLNARVSLVRAQHGKTSAYFAILTAMGNLTPETLGLKSKE